MPTAKLYALSYYQARTLGLPVMRPPAYVPARVSPTRRPRPISRGGVSAALASLGQAGATITLPDGRDHVVRNVNESGEILTTDGWQSTSLPDPAGGWIEQWVDTRTGDVMHADGTITRARAAGPWGWWWIGGGVVAVVLLGYLATQGAPVAGRRVRAAGRGAWAGYRTAA